MDTTHLPTKNNLIKIKNSIKQSEEGQVLLEQKKMILVREKENYEKERDRVKEKLNQMFEIAFYKLKIASMEIGMEDIINISDGFQIDDNIDIKYKTIMGVEVPSIVQNEVNFNINYGLYNTTSSLDEAILNFVEAKKYILELAQIENTIFRLTIAIEKVQRRANALKEIIIPENQKLALEIQEILDESEREEFIRLKKLKSRGICINVKK